MTSKCAGRWRKFQESVVFVLSGEFFLINRANGGTAVLFRSLWVTFLILVVATPAKAYLDKDTVFSFSVEQLKSDLGEVLPWAGAVFAGTYAAFYARFSAQWSYLANLYNQLMQFSLSLSVEEADGNRLVNSWYAAFIEDALDLHLAKKSMFSTMIVELLRDPYVAKAFVESTDNGDTRLKELETSLNFKAGSYRDVKFKSARLRVSSEAARIRSLSMKRNRS